MAMVLEQMRKLFQIEDYRIEAFDIDKQSVAKARMGRYGMERIEKVPSEFHMQLVVDKPGGFFEPKEDIKSRITFATADARALPGHLTDYDLVFCRNMLIYFSQEEASRIFFDLSKRVNADGFIFLGHSDKLESLQGSKEFKTLGNSIYTKVTEDKSQDQAAFHRILILDDDEDCCLSVSDILESSGFRVDYESTPEAMLSRLQKMDFDLVLTDYDMGSLDGLEASLAVYSKDPEIPVVMMSGVVDSEALRDSVHGNVVSFLEKPITQEKIQRAISEASGETHEGPSMNQVEDEVILVGASTGGPSALLSMLRKLPDNLPPVLLVQHIVDDYAENFATVLAQGTSLNLVFAKPGIRTPARRGDLLVVNTDHHLALTSRDGQLCVEASDDPPVGSFRPSVDYLFESAASCSQVHEVTAVVLTGMGSDGSKGLVSLKTSKGCLALAQDEATSVVFGMPKKAIETGLVDFVGTPECIADQVIARSEVRKGRRARNAS